MKTFFCAAAIIVAAYIIIAVGPAAVIFYTHFFPFKAPLHEGKKLKKSYLLPFYDRLEEARRFLSDVKSTPVQLTAKDGVVLKGKFYDRGSKKTAVIVHGYRTNPLTNLPVQLRMLYGEGFNLLCLDNRAQGESGGRICAFGLLERFDLETALQWVKAATDTEQVLIYGVSMGCTTIALETDKLDGAFVKALVLDCGFCSVYNQFYTNIKAAHFPARIIMPWIRLFAWLFTRQDICDRVADTLSKSNIPAFFLHGTKDATVPLENTLQAYEAHGGEKQLAVVEGANHTLALIVGGEETERKLLDFVRRYFSC